MYGSRLGVCLLCPWTAWVRSRRNLNHASAASSNGTDRCRRSALAGERLHTDAGNNQVSLECRRGHLHGAVAIERFRTLQFLFSHPGGPWLIGTPSGRCLTVLLGGNSRSDGAWHCT